MEFRLAHLPGCGRDRYVPVTNPLTYDAGSNVTARGLRDATSILRDERRLATGEVTAIREYGTSSGPGVLATYVYDDRGRRTLLTRGNGTVTSYSYDAVSRLSALRQNHSGRTLKPGKRGSRGPELSALSP